MPVLGHAFVGLAIGMSTRPPVGDCDPGLDPGKGSAFWIPAMVTLAYLPDIVTQIATLAGWSDGRLFGHSIIFAPMSSVLIVPLLMRLAAVSFTRAFACSLISLLVHDVLDLAQATDRVPWWPLSHRHVRVDRALLPTGSIQEAALFGVLLVAFLIVHHMTRSVSDRGRTGSSSWGLRQPWRVWLSHAAVGAIILVAVVTHGLREKREVQLLSARALIEQRSYQAGLQTLAQAERWPSTAKLGRIDYLRAEAYAGMGDRRRAEVHYLRAYSADPMYFWAVADLALFYASSSQPAAERRRLTEPYLARLITDFATHQELPTVMAKVEQKLKAFSSGGVPGIAPARGSDQ